MTFSVLNAFGDSITQGFNASVIGTTDYVSLLAAALGVTKNNQGLSGTGVTDEASVIQPTVVTDTSLSTHMVGTNDYTKHGAGSLQLATWSLLHRAELAYLALLDVAKIKARGGGAGAPVKVGTWTDDIVESIAASAAGTLTFDTAGDVAYIVMVMRDSGAGAYTVTTDGVLQGTYQTQADTPQGGSGSTYDYGPRLIRLAGLGAGTHTHVITHVSGVVGFIWAAGSDAVSAGPAVYAAAVTPRNSFIQGIVDYNTTIAEDVAVLQDDGLPVYFVDTYAAVNPATGLDPDGLHLNDTGHLAVKEAFVAAVGGGPPPPPPPPEGGAQLGVGIGVRLGGRP